MTKIGRPELNIDTLKRHGLDALISIDISISHIKDIAVASTIAIFE